MRSKWPWGPRCERWLGMLAAQRQPRGAVRPLQARLGAPLPGPIAAGLPVGAGLQTWASPASFCTRPGPRGSVDSLTLWSCVDCNEVGRDTLQGSSRSPRGTAVFRWDPGVQGTDLPSLAGERGSPPSSAPALPPDPSTCHLPGHSTCEGLQS